MANVVEIVIRLDNQQAVAASAQTTTAVATIGTTAAATGEKVSAAMTDAAAKVQATVAPAAALEQQMRQMGVSSAAAVLGITKVGEAATETGKRARQASAEMQEMVANIERQQQKYAAMKPPATPAAFQRPKTMGDMFAAYNGSSASDEMARLGNSFAQMPSKIKPASDEIQKFGAHTSSSLDGVRLFAQTLGIRIPRAMENMLARMPAVSSALSGMVQGLFLLGAVEIFARLGEGAYEFAKKIFDVNAAMRDYLATAAKGAEQKLFDEASLETSIALMKEANDEVNKLEKKRHDAGADEPGGGFIQYAAKYAANSSSGFGGPGLDIIARPDPFSADDGKQLALQAANSATATLRANTLRRQAEEEALRNTLSNQEASLGSVAKISAAQQHAATINAKQQADALAREKDIRDVAIATRAYQIKLLNKPDGYKPTQEEELTLAQVHPLQQNAGETERAAADLNARQKAAAASIVLSRSERDQRIAAQNEAINSGLEGEARFDAQRQQAIDAITRKALDGDMTMRTSQALTASLSERFDNERAARLEKQIEDAQKMIRTAGQAGLTGAARIVADHDNRVEDINTDRTLSPEAASLQRQAAQTEENQKLEALQSDYTERVKAEVDSRTEAALSGFAKIDAEQKRMTDAANKTFDTEYGGKNVPKAVKDSGEAQRQAEIASIDRQAATERIKLTEEIQQQTLQMDKEAAQAERRVRASGLMGWVADYRNSLDEIHAAQIEQRSKIDADQKKNGGDPAQYERQKVDADRIANAQIMELNQQLRQQIAGNLQEAFDDPVRYIQQKMKQMMFEILADWLLQSSTFKNMFGDTIGSLKPGSNSGAKGGMVGAVEQHLGVAHPAATAAAGGQASGMAQAQSISTASGAPVGTYGAGDAISTPAAATGTVQQMMAVPGASSTFSEGGGATPYFSDATSLARTGMSAASAISQSSSSTTSSLTATDSDWSDPTKMSSSDPSSAAYNVQPIQDAGGAAAGVSTAMGIAGAAAGTYAGTRGIISSFESGKASGILSGGLSGAAMGASIGMLGGPVGAAIGAGIGAVGGATAGLVGWASGEGGRIQGQRYYRDTIRPQMEEIEKGYLAGSGGDATSAISELNQAARTGYISLVKSAGASAAAWTRDTYITKELSTLTGDIEKLAGGGRDYTSKSAVQFHDGGYIGGFGSFATSGDEGWIHAQQGEVMMNRADSLEHAPLLQRIGSGATPTDIASDYLKATAPANSGGATHYHQHDGDNISAIDAASFQSFLRNRGGIRVIDKELNNYSNTYAGDGQ